MALSGTAWFRNGFSCESQIASLFQDIADEVDDSGRVDAVIVDFAKAFDVVPHDNWFINYCSQVLTPELSRGLMSFFEIENRKSELDNNFQI